MELTDDNLLTLSEYLKHTLSPDVNVRRPGEYNLFLLANNLLLESILLNVQYHKLSRVFLLTETLFNLFLFLNFNHNLRSDSPNFLESCLTRVNVRFNIFLRPFEKEKVYY